MESGNEAVALDVKLQLGVCVESGNEAMAPRHVVGMIVIVIVFVLSSNRCSSQATFGRPA